MKNHFTGRNSHQASEHVLICTSAVRCPRHVLFSRKHWGQRFHSGARQDAYVTITCQEPLTYTLALDNHTTLTDTNVRPWGTQCSFVRIDPARTIDSRMGQGPGETTLWENSQWERQCSGGISHSTGPPNTCRCHSKAKASNISAFEGQ